MGCYICLYGEYYIGYDKVYNLLELASKKGYRKNELSEDSLPVDGMGFRAEGIEDNRVSDKGNGGGGSGIRNSKPMKRNVSISTSTQ